MMLFNLSSAYALLRLGGSTRLDFLQRMSTADVRNLAPGEGRATVLTTPLGRIVDWLLLFADEDCVWALCSAGAREKVVRWLRKHIFFNDDVQLAVPDSPLPIYAVFDAESLCDDLTDQPPLSHRQLKTPHSQWRVARAPAAFGENGWLFFGDWHPPVPALSPADWEIWRIRHGLPAYPHELSEDYIPLETGLWESISFSKGCYVGQEIIARMESRGQLAKKLCLLRVEGDALRGSALVNENGEEVGRLTSIADGSALGYVRTAYANLGNTMRVADAGGAVCTVLRPIRI